MVSMWARIQGVLKVTVKVKGHVIRALLCWHENRFFSPDCDQTCTRWSLGEPASKMCSRSWSRSKVTWYGHFCAGPKIASSRRQMARLRPNLHTMVSRWACIQDVHKVKVKVKGHAIRAFCDRIDRNKNPLKISAKVAVDVLRHSRKCSGQSSLR